MYSLSNSQKVSKAKFKLNNNTAILGIETRINERMEVTWVTA